ncbi:hypothetical protein ZWY2020_014698 [Hordeum vulgare]|nr:hypothetical protein ZWY2020_014698 [Hordeum vulgare]
MLLEERPPDGLRGVGGEVEVDGLVLKRVEDLLAGLAQAGHQPLERLLDGGLGGGRVLVTEVVALELVPTAVRDLHHLELAMTMALARANPVSVPPSSSSCAASRLPSYSSATS